MQDILTNHEQHFSERGRQGRSIRLMMDTLKLPNGASVFYGVDQNTALVLDLDARGAAVRGTVVGQSGYCKTIVCAAFCCIFFG